MFRILTKQQEEEIKKREREKVLYQILDNLYDFYTESYKDWMEDITYEIEVETYNQKKNTRRAIVKIMGDVVAETAGRMKMDIVDFLEKEIKKIEYEVI